MTGFSRTFALAHFSTIGFSIFPIMLTTVMLPTFNTEIHREILIQRTGKSFLLLDFGLAILAPSTIV